MKATKDEKVKLQEKMQRMEQAVQQTEQEIAETLHLAGIAGVCKSCNRVYEKKRRAQKFCSEVCRLAYWKSKRTTNPPRELTCPICGSKFITTDSRKVYCSPQCCEQANLERARARRM